MKIKWKITVFFDALLISIILITAFIVNSKITDLVADKTNAELKNYSELGITLLDVNYPGDWSLDGDKLYKGETLINENYEVVDKISEDTGLLVTIFAGDTRVSTTVKDENGKPKIGTPASSEVVTNVITNGKTFTGSTIVAGKSADTYYVPLKDKDGNTIGMWFVGIYSNVIKGEIFNVMRWILLTLIVIAAIGTAVSFILGKYIAKGYTVVKADLERLEKGDFNIVFHDKSLKRKDEVGDIVRSFYNTQNSIKQIISSIKDETNNIGTSSLPI